jgi:hypothetical protein
VNALKPHGCVEIKHPRIRWKWLVSLKLWPLYSGLCTRWAEDCMGLWVGLYAMAKRKIPARAGNWTPAFKLTASHFTDYTSSINLNTFENKLIIWGYCYKICNGQTTQTLGVQSALLKLSVTEHPQWNARVRISKWRQWWKHVILEARVGVRLSTKCWYHHLAASGAYTEGRNYTAHIRTSTDNLLYQFHFRVLIQLQNRYKSWVWFVFCRAAKQILTGNYVPVRFSAVIRKKNAHIRPPPK